MQSKTTWTPLRANLDLAPSSEWEVYTPTAQVALLPFYLLESGHFYARPGYDTERVDNDRFLLFWTEAGEGQLQYMGKCYTLSPGSLALIWCGPRHSYGSSGKDGWEFKWLHYHGSIAPDYFRMIQPHVAISLPLEKRDAIRERINVLLTPPRFQDFSYHLAVARDIMDVLTTLTCSINVQPPEVSSEAMEKISTVVQYLNDHFSERITLEDMARRSNFSKYHFSRMFKQIMGTSPHEYLTHLRINQCKKHLSLSDLSLDEIAEQSGFSDGKSLIYNFKKHVGIPPMKYKKGNHTL